MAPAYPYAYNMAPTYDDSPEVAPGHNLPEVYTPPHQQQPAWSPQQSTIGTSYVSHPAEKQDGSTVGGYGMENQYQAVGAPTDSGKKRKGAICCGCSLLVFVLSLIIAILSVAVIGLAAGTGVAASNYNDANSKLEAVKASYSSLLNTEPTATASGGSAVPTPSGFNSITNGCSEPNENTSGETYKPSFFNKPTFKMYCNKDASNTPVYSLFAPDFNGCMDACAAWNSYNQSSTPCTGVSFIPLWSVYANAVKGKAPGDCYLKPGPQNATSLAKPNIGTECHAAILE